jgi:cellulose synthase/poly-beta-1,6-N-acetylglucosamine synthase-like glycosyltransferase
MEILLLVAYTLPVLFVMGYSVVQLSLVRSYWKAHQRPRPVPTPLLTDALPFVTIQLPIFNELYVVERLIEAVVQLDYPQDRFEIQILDDSTDETTPLLAALTERFGQQGFRIVHLRRDSRQGYKAGALADGLRTAKGEFVAIFDADFVPNPLFLQQTLPYFADASVGVVQTRWEHLNESFSLLTRLQAFGLDAHFSVEQRGRNAAQHFINFNGTAGVWRKSCIEAAGGWQADTLTEDLDLSYRAQMAGWRFVYLEHVASPAELPVEMSAIKSQQFRWTKGAAECARKHLRTIWQHPTLSLSTKTHALFHLTNSTAYLCVVWLAVLSIPVLFVKSHFPAYQLFFWVASGSQISLLSLGIFYWFSFRVRHHWANFFWTFPVFLSFMMGLSLYNALAVIEGLIGKKTPFVRTPKFNVQKATDGWQHNKYLAGQLTWFNWLEMSLALYFLGGIVLAFVWQDFGLLPFHVMLTFGFGSVFFYALRHARVPKTT